MSIKQQMKDALTLISGEMSNYGYQLWNNFIYGNYDESDYRNCLEMANNPVLHMHQRNFVITSYTKILALEFGCSYGHAQKTIVGLFPKEKLESITNEFINDLNKVGE